MAHEIFNAASNGETKIAIPAIVMAEFYYANAKNKWFKDFGEIYRQIMAKPFFKYVPMRIQHIADFDQDSRVPEMHDRIIAGVARRLNAPLITRDPQIVNAGVVRTLW